MRSRALLIAFLAVASSVNATFVLGQEQSNPPSSQPITSESAPQSTGGWPTPEEAVGRMNTKLNLSDDQKAKITPIIADRQTQMRALMADNSGRRLQKARKAKSILSESDKKIEAVLTADQRKTYAQMKEQTHEQMRSHMH